jgi:hypothetical protein
MQRIKLVDLGLKVHEIRKNFLWKQFFDKLLMLQDSWSKGGV